MLSFPPPRSWSSILLLCVLVALSPSPASTSRGPDHGLEKRQTPSASPLVDFQVSEPILVPTGTSDQYGCVHTQLLMDHVFAFSYGQPFVGTYTPPPCSFNRVTINFTVTSRGRQFDRLGLMFLGDIEVFRTSTAEPTTNGIVWTYFKEMEQYNALWKTNQKIIFDLGNLIDNTYTGTFNTTLTATFSTIPTLRAAADQILPISARRSGANGPSAFSVPTDNASVAYQIPQNAERAVVSLSACGQASEEFWYTNVFNSEVNTFEDEIGTLSGFSPFREVQLLIDGRLAGVSWPFPIIFTGGIVPGFWRPIVGIDAFDLREHEIDITPWLPILCDGASHTFEIRVVGINDDGPFDASLSEAVGNAWVVTGKIFLFLGPEGSTTSGNVRNFDTPPPKLTISSQLATNATGANETLLYKTSASRTISITSDIKTSNGTTFPASWTQQITYTNLNILSAQGFTQFTQQQTSGTDLSSSKYVNKYSYPLTVNSTFSTTNGIGITATLSRGLDFAVTGPSVFPPGTQSFNHTSSPAFFALPGHQQQLVPYTAAPLPYLAGAHTITTQTGNAAYLSAGNASYSYGTTDQDFTFQGVETDAGGANFELYRRSVRAVNSSVVSDVESLVGRRGKKVVLSINRFERKKNIGLAIRAFQGLKEEGRRGVRLVLAGGYDPRVDENLRYHEELVQLAEGLGLKVATTKNVVTALSIPDNTDVLFLLSVPAQLKTMLLSAARLLVYTPTNEHFGIVPLEAMLAGVPVLAADSGGPLETVLEAKTGWLRSAEKVEEWTEIMERVLHKMSDGELSQMGEEGKKWVQSEFSEKKLADRLEEEIDVMLNSPRKETLEIPDLLLGVGFFAMIATVVLTFLYRFLT
ncbi:MAG: hypothetical protein Q9170_004208 [Blastenia crenularia]